MNLFSRTFHIDPYRIKAVATFSNDQVISLDMEWSPNKPDSLTDAQIDDYIVKRDAILKELAVEITAKHPRWTPGHAQ